MDQQSALVLALVFGFVSGLVVGWVQGSAPQKVRLQGLELDLVQSKANLMVLESELVKVRMREKDSALVSARLSEQVKELRSQLESVLDSEMEKLPESEKV
jgi:hypothetical protein